MRDPAERRAFIIHGLDDARAVLAAAAETGRPVALWSAPGAAAYLGALLFGEIIKTAMAECPGVDAIGVLDCGQDAGYALAAVRHGIRFLRTDLPPDTLARVADIAGQSGATIVGQRPQALNLADCPEPVAACRTWLSEPGG
jgi:hypothetical protein